MSWTCSLDGAFIREVEIIEELFEIIRNYDRRGDYKEIRKIKDMIWGDPRSFWSLWGHCSENNLHGYLLSVIHRLESWEENLKNESHKTPRSKSLALD